MSTDNPDFKDLNKNLSYFTALISLVVMVLLTLIAVIL